MKNPKRCLSENCRHRHECEYAAIQDRTLAAFPDAEDRFKYGGPTIHPVAAGCQRWKDNPRVREIVTTILLTLAIWCNAQTIEQVSAEIRRQGLPHPDIVLAQARLETGNFTSARCKRDHNLFGIKHRGKYARYSRWQESVADYKRCISARYAGGDYYAFLRRIGYASDPNYERKLRRF